jgi:hypothetical protein
MSKSKAVKSPEVTEDSNVEKVATASPKHKEVGTLKCQYCGNGGQKALVLRKREDKSLEVCAKCAQEIDTLNGHIGLGKEKKQASLNNKKVKAEKTAKVKTPKVIELPKVEGNKIIAYGKEILITKPAFDAPLTLAGYKSLKYWEQKKFIMRAGASKKLDLVKEIGLLAKADGAHIKADLCNRWIENMTTVAK